MFGRGFPGDSVIKNLPASAGDTEEHRFDPWIGKIPRRREWQPTPVFLLGKSMDRRAWRGYSSGGHKEKTGLSTHSQQGNWRKDDF